MPRDRTMDDIGLDRQDIVVGRKMVNTALDKLGMSEGKMLIGIMAVNAKRKTKDCLDSGQPCQMKLTFGCRASCTYKYYCNDYT